MEDQLGILGSCTEKFDLGVADYSVPDEAGKRLDSFSGTVSGTVGHFAQSTESVSSLESIVRP